MKESHLGRDSEFEQKQRKETKKTLCYRLRRQTLLAIAVSLAFQGFLLVYSGFDSKLELQTLETVKFWLLALIVTQPLGCFIGLFSILLYPLTRERCHQIRLELSARKKARVQA